MKDKINIIVLIIVLYIGGVTAGLFTGLIISEMDSSAPMSSTYFATYYDGHKEIVTDLMVIPLQEPNDVGKIWPVYIKIQTAKCPVIKQNITLKSRPFILSDNPNIHGQYDGRMVYYVPE